MSSFPLGISSMKLKVSTFEQVISSASLGSNNHILITNPDILTAFEPGVTINPSIVVTYSNSAFPSSNIVAAGTPYVLPYPVSLLANGVTIKYDANPADVPTSTAKFIHADPRGTGMEWFAVVKNGMKNIIKSYSISSAWAGSFTPPSETSPVPFNNIVTTLMTDMSSMFYLSSTFNQLIESWDTSNVTDMQTMFYGAIAFNQPINSWDTSKVTNMIYMFGSASVFNRPLNSWNTSNVTNMGGMFIEAFVFNQPLNLWNTSKVTNMGGTFYRAWAFNQNISGWNVSLVTAYPNFRVESALTTDNTPPAFR